MNYSCNLDERKPSEFQSGTVVIYGDKDETIYGYGIICKNIDRETIGIFDLEDNIVYTDYENYVVYATFENSKIDIQ